MFKTCEIFLSTYHHPVHQLFLLSVSVFVCENSQEEITVIDYPHGTAVIVERQMMGRGTKHHQWHSENTGNIYLSFILYLPQLDVVSIDLILTMKLNLTWSNKLR